MLDEVIHQQNRLHLLATLARNQVMPFTELRDACGLTTGNAGNHLERLASAGYVKSGRLLVGFRFELHYRITETGLQRFREYLEDLRRMVGEVATASAATATATQEAGAPSRQ